MSRPNPVSSYGPPIATSASATPSPPRSEEHTSELQSRLHLVCRLLLEKKKKHLLLRPLSYDEREQYRREPVLPHELRRRIPPLDARDGLQECGEPPLTIEAPTYS